MQENFNGPLAADLVLTNHAVSTGAFSGTARRPLVGKVRQGIAHFTIEAQTVARIKLGIDEAGTNKTDNQLTMHPSLIDTAGYLTTAQLTEVLDDIVTRRTAGDLQCCHHTNSWWCHPRNAVPMNQCSGHPAEAVQ